MQLSVRLGPFPLCDFNDTAQVSAPFEKWLAAFGCRVDGPPALHSYGPLIENCCNALAPTLEELRARGYRSWLLMVGANMTLERRSRYPAYALSSPAKREGLLEGQNVEQNFQRDGNIRTAGLYEMRPEQFREECLFLQRNSWTLGILSNRPEFLAMPDLTAIYDAAGWNEDGSPAFKTNFLQLSTLLGPLGDVIVKTDGAFDDRWRSVNLVYDPSAPVSAIFAAARPWQGVVLI